MKSVFFLEFREKNRFHGRKTLRVGVKKILGKVILILANIGFDMQSK